MAAGRKRVMRLPKGGKACPLPPVPGTPIAQHLANNSGAPVATPPSVPQPSVATPATKTIPIATAAKPFIPTKATSFTQRNQRTQKGATIVDLEYNGQMVGTLAQLPNGKWTVRDANGQGIGKQVHTSWLARKLLSDYINAKGGNIAPAPAPQPAPIAPTPKPAPPVPTPPTPPPVSPPPAPAPAKTAPAPILPKTPTALPVSQFSGGRQWGEAWRVAPLASRMTSNAHYWRQTKAKKFGVQTEWDIEVSKAWNFDGIETATFASMVRVEGGFNVRLSPEFVKLLQDRFIQTYPQNAARVQEFIPDEITFTANNASRAMTIAKSAFTHGFGAMVNMPAFIGRIQDDIAGAIKAKQEAATPLGTSRSKMTPADKLNDGIIQGRDIVWDTDAAMLQEILDLHEQSGRRGSSNSDKGLDKIAELQGWDRGRPALTELQTFWDTAAISDHLFLRGDTHHAYASQFKLWASQFYGKGIFGNGTYSAYHRLGASALMMDKMAYQSQATARQYADGGYNVEGPVTLGRMKNGARIIEMKDFMQAMYDDYALALTYRNAYREASAQAKYNNNPQAFAADPANALIIERNNRARRIMEMLSDDSGNLIGLYAGLKGYDGIIIQPNAFPHNFPTLSFKQKGDIDVPALNAPQRPMKDWNEVQSSANQYLLVMNRSATIAVSGDMHSGAGRSPTSSDKGKNGALSRAPKPATFTRISSREVGTDNPLNVFMNAMERLFVQQAAESVLATRGMADAQGNVLEQMDVDMNFDYGKNDLIENWIEKYERAILRGTTVRTITWDESRAFEEIYAKPEDLDTAAGD